MTTLSPTESTKWLTWTMKVGKIGESHTDLKGEVNSLREEIRSTFHRLEVKMIRSIIGTVLFTSALTFTIARVA